MSDLKWFATEEEWSEHHREQFARIERQKLWDYYDLKYLKKRVKQLKTKIKRLNKARVREFIVPKSLINNIIKEGEK